MGSDNFAMRHRDLFRAGLREGELRVQKCASCGTVAAYTARCCGACQSVDLHWSAASGLGKLRCTVEVTASFIPEHPAPYLLASIELDEGPHIIARYQGAPANEDGKTDVKAQFFDGQLLFAAI
ncbi:Zn-ribbon domain-containing OB-fold protein [Tsuneonella sp. HG094]